MTVMQVQIGNLFLFAATIGLVFTHTASSQTSAPPVGLTLLVAAGRGWESNPAFILPAGADVATLLLAEAMAVERTARTSFSLTARGGAYFFQRLTSQSRFTNEIAADGTRRFSARWNGSLRASMQTSRSSDINSSDDRFGLLPLTVSRSRAGALVTSYLISPVTSATLEGRYVRVSFDSPLFTPGTSAGGQVGILHRYEERSSYGFQYGVEENTILGRSQPLQTATANWEPLSGSAGVRFTAGVAAVDSGRNTFRKASAIGSADIHNQIGPGITRIRYARWAGQAFGLARVLVTNQVSFGYETAPLRRTTVLLNADRAWSEDHSDPTFRVVTTNGTLRLRTQLGAGVTIGSDAFVQKRDQLLRVSDRGVRVVVGYALTSR